MNPDRDHRKGETSRSKADLAAEEEFNSPVAVEARLGLAVKMLDAAVAELRGLMSQLQTTTTTTTTTTSMSPEESQP
jgi:hypothetical protein